MNDEQLQKKVNQDAARVKKDVSTLVGDSSTQLSRLEDNLSQAAGKAKDDVSSWMEDGVSQISTDLGKFSAEAKDSLVEAAASVSKDVGQQLRNFNAKAQEFADKAPGEIGKKAALYPWIAISIGLVFGLLIGSLMKPSRHA